MTQHPDTSRPPFRALFVHTHDVARSLKPSADGELAHALHQTLHFALDGHPDDYGIHSLAHKDGCHPLATMPSSTSDSPTTNGHSDPPQHQQEQQQQQLRARPGFFPTDDPERPFQSYLWHSPSATLTLPNPSTINNPVADPCSSDLRSAYEITAKFFYLAENAEGPERFPAQWIDDAFQRLTRTTGLITLDTFIVAFPTLDLDGLRMRALQRTHSRPGQPNGLLPTPCCGDESAPGSAAAGSSGSGSGSESGSAEGLSEAQKADLAAVGRVWNAISLNPQFLSLGLSDVSQPSLQHLLANLDPPLPPLTFAQQHQSQQQQQQQQSQQRQQQNSDGTPTGASAIFDGTAGSSGATRNGIDSSSSSSTSSPSSLATGTATSPNPTPSSLPMAPTLSAQNSTKTSSLMAPYTVPSASRRPRVVEVNVKTDPCGFDRSLSRWCSENGMLLIAHSDRRDPLPARTIPALLEEFQGVLPFPLPRGKAGVRPKWVIKYTTLIRDRGVLADKGYILYAEVE